MQRKEIFKTIKGFDDNYEISNTGKVISYKRASPSEMKNSVNKLGHRSVNLRTSDNKTAKVYLSRLVYEAFGELPEDYDRDKYVIVHKDGNYGNLDISNLEIMLKSEHTRERFKGKNIIKTEDKKDLPKDAILLKEGEFSLTGIIKKEERELEPKIKLLKETELFVRKGSSYEKLSDFDYAILLKQGDFFFDDIGRMLESTFTNVSWSSVRMNELYTLKSMSEAGKKTYEYTGTEDAFIIKKGDNYSINTIKETVLSMMKPAKVKVPVSRLWMYWNGLYNRVSVNQFEESKLSPVNIRGSLTIRVRKENLSPYMQDYIFGKKGHLPQDWYTIPCATIMMEEWFGNPRPTAKHVLGFKDFNFLNLTEDNLMWETQGEREKRIQERFPDFTVYRSKISEDTHLVGINSDRVKQLIEKYYFLEGKSIAKINRMVNDNTEEDMYPRIRFYIYGIKSGKYIPQLDEVSEMLKE